MTLVVRTRTDLRGPERKDGGIRQNVVHLWTRSAVFLLGCNAPAIARAMIVVSDAGPLNYLILIGQIELLPSLYGQVVVPATVVNELQHLHTPVTVRAWIGAPSTWLDIRKTDVIDPTGTPLGVGELAAITMAEQLHADLVLMDDLDGRIEAERLHLKVIGTLGVLRDAAFFSD